MWENAMRLTKGLRALIESEDLEVLVTCRFYGGPLPVWRAALVDRDGHAVLICDSERHSTKRAAIKDLDAVVARMARVFTGAR